MAEDSLEKAYSELLHRGRLTGEVDEEPEERERRRHPRLRVDSTDIQVNADPWAILIDISPTGIAYHSDTPHDIGTTVTIGLEDGFSLSAEVVQLSAEPEDSAESLLGRFRVSCRFAEPTEGQELALRLKALEEAQAE